VAVLAVVVLMIVFPPFSGLLIGSDQRLRQANATMRATCHQIAKHEVVMIRSIASFMALGSIRQSEAGRLNRQHNAIAGEKIGAALVQRIILEIHDSVDLVRERHSIGEGIGGVMHQLAGVGAYASGFGDVVHFIFPS
jgi:hypothetical protein